MAMKVLSVRREHLWSAKTALFLLVVCLPLERQTWLAIRSILVHMTSRLAPPRWLLRLQEMF